MLEGHLEFEEFAKRVFEILVKNEANIGWELRIDCNINDNSRSSILFMPSSPRGDSLELLFLSIKNCYTQIVKALKYKITNFKAKLTVSQEIRKIVLEVRTVENVLVEDRWKSRDKCI